MITRQKPEDAPEEAWIAFNELADDQAIGDEIDDWGYWWDFFYHGWCAREEPPPGPNSVNLPPIPQRKKARKKK